MKICFIAYADSIHTRRWVEYFCNVPENEVHVLTLLPCLAPIEGATVHSLSGPGLVAQIRADSTAWWFPAAQAVVRSIRSNGIGNSLMYKFENESNWGLLPYRILRCRNRARAIVEGIRPDLVHCLGIPYGGSIGGLIGYRPLIVSTWGTDFVYFARRSPVYRWLTRKVLAQTDLLLADSLRDKYLAEVYGFCPGRLSCVMPATGGLKLDEFPLRRKDNSARARLGIAPGTNLIISIRGFKSFHVNTETLIRAIPRIVAGFPDSLFVIDGAYQSSGYFRLKMLAERLKVEKYIRFTDRLSRPDLADYLAASDIMVSVTIYDGLPISMLEGMAYGVVPVMSNHSSIQEWITDGQNGYLFDPEDPEDIARAVTGALREKDRFEAIRERNWALLEERADHYRNMKTARELYGRLIS